MNSTFTIHVTDVFDYGDIGRMKEKSSSYECFAPFLQRVCSHIVAALPVTLVQPR